MAFTDKENEAIQAKIAILEAEGKPADQAIAIALDMFRRGTLPPVTSNRKNLEQKRKQMERRFRDRRRAQFRKQMKKRKTQRGY